MYSIFFLMFIKKKKKKRVLPFKHEYKLIEIRDEDMINANVQKINHGFLPWTPALNTSQVLIGFIFLGV